MNKKTTGWGALAAVIVVVVSVGIYSARNTSEFVGNIFISYGLTGMLFKNDCEGKTNICTILIISNNESHSLARITYNYIKGAEDSNRLFIYANKGNFDNKVGNGDVYSLSEGRNTINVKFGLHRSAENFRDKPYTSSFMMVEVRGLDHKANSYIHPKLIDMTFDFKRSWYKPL